MSLHHGRVQSCAYAGPALTGEMAALARMQQLPACGVSGPGETRAPKTSSLLNSQAVDSTQRPVFDYYVTCHAYSFIV